MISYIRDAIMSPTTRSSSNNKKSSQPTGEVLKDVSSSESRGTAGAPMRGYKVTDNERTRKYGIGANSLEMLIAKAKSKFPVRKKKQEKLLRKSAKYTPTHIDGLKVPGSGNFQGHVPGSGFRVCLALFQCH